MDSLLATQLTRATLRRWVGRGLLGIAETYCLQGRVGPVTVGKAGDTLEAAVHDPPEQTVRLWVEQGGLRSSCTCEFKDSKIVCVHVAAAGLAWLDPARAIPAELPPLSEREKQTQVEGYLARQDRAALLELLQEQSARDDELRQRLWLKAASEGGDLRPMRVALRKTILKGTQAGDPGAGPWLQRLDALLDTLGGWQSEGRSAAVYDLVTYTLALLDESGDFLNDRPGRGAWITGRLQELHIASCRAVRPDPEALARELFKRELDSNHDAWSDVAVKYADVLGDAGLAAYRRLLEAAWEQIPALKSRPPGYREGQGPEIPHRYRLSGIMASLARRSGDVDRLAAVLSKNLSSEFDFLGIAEEYRKADRHDLALEWAERGRAAFAGNPGPALRTFLAEEYARLGRDEASLALLWDNFTQDCGTRTYEALKLQSEQAKTAGRWPEQRRKAWGWMRAQIREAAAPGARPRGSREAEAAEQWRDHSHLVELLLWEQDPDAAWQEAQSGGCRPSLWLELARKRAASQPADGIPILKTQIERALVDSDRQAYAYAVQLLTELRDLLTRAGRAAAFGACVTEVRRSNLRRPTLVKMLGEAFPVPPA